MFDVIPQGYPIDAINPLLLLGLCPVCRSWLLSKHPGNRSLCIHMFTLVTPSIFKDHKSEAREMERLLQRHKWRGEVAPPPQTWAS